MEIVKSVDTMFYKNIYMGYFFPLKDIFSENVPLPVFALIKAAQLHV